MIELLAAPAVSGVIGAIGGYFNKRLELSALKEQNTHELAMVEAQTQASVTIASIEMDKAEVVGKWEQKKQEMLAFRASQSNKSEYADVIKSVIRPLILLATGYLCWENLSAIQAMTEAQEALTGEQLIQLYTTVVTSVFSLFSMGVGWYFGQRTTKITDKFLSIRQ